MLFTFAYNNKVAVKVNNVDGYVPEYEILE